MASKERYPCKSETCEQPVKENGKYCGRCKWSYGFKHRVFRNNHLTYQEAKDERIVPTLLNPEAYMNGDQPRVDGVSILFTDA